MSNTSVIRAKQGLGQIVYTPVVYPQNGDVNGRTLYLARDEEQDVRWFPDFLEAQRIGARYDYGMEDGSPSDEPMRWCDVKLNWVEVNPRTDADIIGACPVCESNVAVSFGPDSASGYPTAKCGCGETWTLGLGSPSDGAREDFHADG